jgi:hypothetical protein
MSFLELRKGILEDVGDVVRLKVAVIRAGR